MIALNKYLFLSHHCHPCTSPTDCLIQILAINTLDQSKLHISFCCDSTSFHSQLKWIFSPSRIPWPIQFPMAIAIRTDPWKSNSTLETYKIISYARYWKITDDFAVDWRKCNAYQEFMHEKVAKPAAREVRHVSLSLGSRSWIAQNSAVVYSNQALELSLAKSTILGWYGQPGERTASPMQSLLRVTLGCRYNGRTNSQRAAWYFAFFRWNLVRVYSILCDMPRTGTGRSARENLSTTSTCLNDLWRKTYHSP